MWLKEIVNAIRFQGCVQACSRKKQNYKKLGFQEELGELGIEFCESTRNKKEREWRQIVETKKCCLPQRRRRKKRVFDLSKT